MKAERGVTITALAIIVIVTLIVATAVTYTGMQEIEDSRKKNFTTELKTIREKIDLYADKGEEAYESIGKDTNILTAEELGTMKEIAKLEDITQYRYMDSEEYKKLGLENIENVTIVNFKTREVISVNGIDIEGQLYYTLEQLDAEKYMPEYDG